MATETRVQKKLIFGWEQITETFLHPLCRLHPRSLGGLTQPGNPGCQRRWGCPVPGEPEGIAWGTTHGSCPHYSLTNSKAPELKAQLGTDGTELPTALPRGSTRAALPCSGCPLTHHSPSWCVTNASAEHKRFSHAKPPGFFHIAWEPWECRERRGVGLPHSGGQRTGSYCPSPTWQDKATAVALMGFS